jgi:hypothetical protein
MISLLQLDRIAPLLKQAAGDFIMTEKNSVLPQRSGSNAFFFLDPLLTSVAALGTRAWEAVETAWCLVDRRDIPPILVRLSLIALAATASCRRQCFVVTLVRSDWHCWTRPSPVFLILFMTDKFHYHLKDRTAGGAMKRNTGPPALTRNMKRTQGKDNRDLLILSTAVDELPPVLADHLSRALHTGAESFYKGVAKHSSLRRPSAEAPEVGREIYNKMVIAPLIFQADKRSAWCSRKMNALWRSAQQTRKQGTAPTERFAYEFEIAGFENYYSARL